MPGRLQIIKNWGKNEIRCKMKCNNNNTNISLNIDEVVIDNAGG